MSMLLNVFTGSSHSHWSCYFFPETSQECRDRAFDLMKSSESWKNGIVTVKENYTSKEIWAGRVPRYIPSHTIHFFGEETESYLLVMKFILDEQSMGKSMGLFTAYNRCRWKFTCTPP